MAPGADHGSCSGDLALLDRNADAPVQRAAFRPTGGGPERHRPRDQSARSSRRLEAWSMGPLSERSPARESTSGSSLRKTFFSFRHSSVVRVISRMSWRSCTSMRVVNANTPRMMAVMVPLTGLTHPFDGGRWSTGGRLPQHDHLRDVDGFVAEAADAQDLRPAVHSRVHPARFAMRIAGPRRLEPAACWLRIKPHPQVPDGVASSPPEGTFDASS
jgi:hypothetical protein